jgi:hypothetical protein
MDVKKNLEAQVAKSCKKSRSKSLQSLFGREYEESNV